MSTYISDPKHQKSTRKALLGSSKKRQSKIIVTKNIVTEDEGLRRKLREIDEMTNDEVNRMLFSMLNDMELPEHSKPSIFTRPLNERKDLLKIWLQKRWDSSSQGQSTEEEFVDQLEQNMSSPDQLILILERLKVSLSTYYISWVQKFADKGGHRKLNKVLSKWSAPLVKDEKTKKVLLYCVRCIKTFMNNKFGLNQMLEEEEALITLLGVLDAENENILVDVLKIAAPICLVANGHDKVLEALTEQGNRQCRGRFDPVIRALLDTSLPSTQSACLLFINSVISPPDEFTYRIHLRNEFIRGGLDEFIQKISQTASDDLAVQLKIYNDLKEADFDEFQSKWHGVQSDMLDATEVFNILIGVTENTEAEKPFLSILQHLLLVRDDYFIRPLYFKLIEQCITQIVLQKGGIDPDFHYTKKFDIDVDPLMDNMVVKAQVEEARERAFNYEKQLKDEQVARHDLESKLCIAEQSLARMKEEREYEKGFYQQQIVQLQKGGVVVVPPPPSRSNVMVDIPEPPRNLPEVEALLPPPPKQVPILLHGNLNIPAPPPNLPEVDDKLGISSNRGKSRRNQIDLPKKKIREKLSTKRLNWVKVKETEMNESAFWAKLREDKLENPDIIADLKKLFGQEGRRPVDKGDMTTTTHSMTGSFVGSRRVQEPQVLEAKTCQNLSILLMSLKHPHELIKKMILSMDESLGLQWLEQLVKYLPNKKYIDSLNRVKDKFNDLNQAEQFILVITKIDRLETRLETMIFRKKFRDEIADLVPDLRLVKKACNEVKNSPKFAKILEYILMMGNVMNAGTNNAGSYGFSLEFLTRLEDTKGVSDHSTTVLNFLVSTLEKHDPELLKFPRELESVNGSSRVSYQDLKQRIRAIQISIEAIRAELKNYKHGAKDPNDLYGEVMTQFLTSAEGESQNVRKLHKEMEEDVAHLLDWYAMDSQKNSMEEMFRYIRDFVRSFEKAKKQNEEMKEKKKREEKAKKRLEEMKKKQTNTKQRVTRTGVVNLDEMGDDKSDNVLDNLLDSLRTGRAFDTRFVRPRKKPLQMDQLRSSHTPYTTAINHHDRLYKPDHSLRTISNGSPILPLNNNHSDNQPTQAQLMLDRIKTLPPNSESTFL